MIYGLPLHLCMLCNDNHICQSYVIISRACFTGTCSESPRPHVAERVADDLYSSESEEVILKTTPVMSQDTITRSDLQDIIDGWEEKFDKLAEGVRAIEEGTHEKFDKLAEGVRAIEEGTHDVHAHVDMVMRENRAHENGQLATNKQLKLIQEALARFMETCDPAHPTPVRTFVQQCAPKMSTPITPSGAPTRYRSEFSLRPL